MARLFAIASLAVGGIIVADVLIHPQGTKAASNGIVSISKPVINGLLGQAS